MRALRALLEPLPDVPLVAVGSRFAAGADPPDDSGQ